MKKAKTIKEHSLTGRITFKRMLKAFRKVKMNRGRAGIDKVSIKMFEANLYQNLEVLMKELKGRKYKPSPLLRAYIPKGKKEKRPLGIPAVRDRVAQEVIRSILDPIFTPSFHKNSFGFIEGRNCHQAIEQVLSYHKNGFKFVVDADISKFFDNIPHHVIMNAVAEKVADGNILRLIESFLTAGVMENGILSNTIKGTPQGGVISPLLANIVLNKLDWYLEEHGIKFVRYADDFVILTKSKHEAEEALVLAQQFIKDNLELKLNKKKTNISSFRKGFDFLGFRISAHGCRMRDKSVEKLKDKVRSITVRHHNLSNETIQRVNVVLKGIVNYFVTKFSHCKQQFEKIDHWIRMRIRCMKFKRKSYRDNYRLINKHLRNLGLLSLKELASKHMQTVTG